MEPQLSHFSHFRVRLIGSLAVMGYLLISGGLTAQTLTNGLVAYWPLNDVQGTKTPDLVSGYDMDLNNLTASNLVEGKVGRAFSFSNPDKTLLSRVHSASDELPANKHESFTVGFWSKVDGNGQNDLRLFSEGSTSASDPLFNIGTDSGGASGSVDLFFRQSGWTIVNHIKTTQQPFDGQWHHVVFVQNAGERVIYIDGVADDLPIPAKEPGNWRLNDTTIGGILRASPSHWVTGLIDEVAIWKRGLTEAEVSSLFTNGMPAIASRLLPLEIRSFAPDFPAVAAGDKVTLRWEVSKDASVSLEPGVGNVTSDTVAGSGSRDVTVSADTTFTLQLTRGNEQMSTQTVVRAVAGVAAGWRLLDNFETYPAGQIRGNWKNPEGAVNVVDFGRNKALGFGGGDDLSALELRNLTLTEGAKATLFFRVYATTNSASSIVAIHTGLTERPIRFIGDFAANVGPYIRLEKSETDPLLSILARNGVGAGYDVAPIMLEPGLVYNLWIDVENVAGTPADPYSVFLQKQGEAARASLFQGYLSDRDPQGTPDLGAPGPNLPYLLAAALGAQGVDEVVLDDFYLSANGFLTSVPVAATGFAPGAEDIQINSANLNRTTGIFRLTWTSQPGRTYMVQKKARLTDPWLAGVPVISTGSTAEYSEPIAGQTSSFYRITGGP